jgi:hypothetical protein
MSFQSWNRAAVQAPEAIASRGSMKDNVTTAIMNHFDVII